MAKTSRYRTIGEGDREASKYSTASQHASRRARGGECESMAQQTRTPLPTAPLTALPSRLPSFTDCPLNQRTTITRLAVGQDVTFETPAQAAAAAASQTTH